ncbi:hypothetical protein B9Z51_08475 [Limnohabitans sp. T6-5]|uniref:tetratricopeptide repeat protein n=1 Tax=Limnohabitans sp. T6-5 TaxID=1100724 RepID=UPI000DD1D157|nr:tetratricopeptide repeat protein [Limnohabitans sp. T6-5]PUE08960.1 hypothetical protein B9Z51_08475 [Limnohabitans sp. T6-5]
MIKPLSTLLKSLLVCTALAASALALALPAPKDIETAVSQGHLTQAESMLREVIAAKPQSAKAHYELGQVLLRENRASEAHAELVQAQSIDPSLKFASSDKQFKDLLERSQVQLNAQPAKAVGTHAAPQAPASSGSGFSLTYVWIGIAVLGVIALLIRMNRPAVQTPTPAYAPPAPPAGGPLSTAFGRQPGYAPAPAGYPTGYPSGYPAAAPSGGSTVAGAVVGGLAGVAAGYALSKALEGEHHNPSAPVPSGNSWADNQGLVSADSPNAAPLGAFDAGTGDDWDGDSGANSDDDSW